MSSSGPPHKDDQKSDDQRYTIETGGERGSGKSTLAARHEDDDDDIPDLTIYLFSVLHKIDNVFWLTVYVVYQILEKSNLFSFFLDVFS